LADLTAGEVDGVGALGAGAGAGAGWTVWVSGVCEYIMLTGAGGGG